MTRHLTSSSGIKTAMIMVSHSEFKYTCIPIFYFFLLREDFSSKLRQQLFDYIASGCLERKAFPIKGKQIARQITDYKQYENKL